MGAARSSGGVRPRSRARTLLVPRAVPTIVEPRPVVSTGAVHLYRAESRATRRNLACRGRQRCRAGLRARGGWEGVYGRVGRLNLATKTRRGGANYYRTCDLIRSGLGFTARRTSTSVCANRPHPPRPTKAQRCPRPTPSLRSSATSPSATPRQLLRRLRHGHARASVKRYPI